MKKSKVIYYIAAVFLAGILGLVYFGSDHAEKTEPKVKLSYFKSNLELAESIHSTLQPEMKQQKHFWFGIEPGAPQELDIYKELKALIEKENGPFEIVYVDQELKLPPGDTSLFGSPTPRLIKENWHEVAADIQKNADKNLLIITASIYSTNVIEENPLNKIKTLSGIKPITFSMGYFATTPEEERNNVFPCRTDDKEGVASWGCLVVNKARAQRRKIDMSKLNDSMKPGLMDLTGEKAYMILVR